MKKKRSAKTVKIIIVIITVFLLLLMLAYSVMYCNGYSGRYADAEYTDGQIKVACVGDSITYGHGISGWSKNNYPSVLSDKLGEKYCVRNFGVSGSTAQSTGDKPYLQTKRFSQLKEFKADIIILMIGSNDSKPENWQGAEEFRMYYEELLDALLDGNEGARVYLCTPAKPYYTDGKTDGLMNFDIDGERIEEIVPVVSEIAGERGYDLIDINALTAVNPQWFERDGVHPDNNGAAEIANAVAAEIIK